MLNQFTIRTALTVGLLSVIVLLVIVTGAVYFALDTSQKSTQEMLQIKTNHANIQTLRIYLHRAHLAATSDSHVRNLQYRKDRQEIDKKIADLADNLQQTLAGRNLENLRRLLAEYENFKGTADQLFRSREERVKLEANLIAMGKHTLDLVHKCIGDLTADAEVAEKMEEDEGGYVRRDTIRPAMTLEKLAIDIHALHHGYYLMMEETNYETQLILGKELENTVDTLVATLTDFAQKTTNATRQDQIEEINVALQKWKTVMGEVVALLDSQSQNCLDITAIGDRMMEILAQMIECVGYRLNTIRKEMAACDVLMINIMIGTTLAVVIVGICCGLILNSNIGNRH